MDFLIKLFDFMVVLAQDIVKIRLFERRKQTYCFYSYENDCIVDNPIRQNIRSHILVNIITGGETRECYSNFQYKTCTIKTSLT